MNIVFVQLTTNSAHTSCIILHQFFWQMNSLSCVLLAHTVRKNTICHYTKAYDDVNDFSF